MKKYYILSIIAIIFLSLVSCSKDNVKPEEKMPVQIVCNEDCHRLQINGNYYQKNEDGVYQLSEDHTMWNCCKADYNFDTKEVTVTSHYEKENYENYSNLEFEIEDGFEYCYTWAVKDPETGCYHKFSKKNGKIKYWASTRDYRNQDCCLCEIVNNKLVAINHAPYDNVERHRIAYYVNDHYTITNPDTCCRNVVVYDITLGYNVLFYSMYDNEQYKYSYALQYYYDNSQTNYCTGNIDVINKTITITNHKK